MATDHRQEYDLASQAAEQMRSAGLGVALAAVQTGSGLPMPQLTSRQSLPWHEIKGFPRATAPGHRGIVHYGSIGGVPVLVLEGRLHTYEGHSAAEVVRPIRALGLLGVANLILTNSAGGVRHDLETGDLVRIVDHVNLLGVDPLAGIHEPRFGDRFPVTARRSHDQRLARLADEAALELGIALSTGVYGGVLGPSFETESEVRMLRTLGIDVCGMSTVPEILAATQIEMSVLVLSLVANPAGQVSADVTAEKEVLDVGAQHGGRLMKIVEGIVSRLGGAPR